MFSINPEAKIINCNTCGDITEQIIKRGKIIKNALNVEK